MGTVFDCSGYRDKLPVDELCFFLQCSYSASFMMPDVQPAAGASVGYSGCQQGASAGCRGAALFRERDAGPVVRRHDPDELPGGQPGEALTVSSRKARVRLELPGAQSGEALALRVEVPRGFPGVGPCGALPFRFSFASLSSRQLFFMAAACAAAVFRSPFPDIASCLKMSPVILPSPSCCTG